MRIPNFKAYRRHALCRRARIGAGLLMVFAAVLPRLVSAVELPNPVGTPDFKVIVGRMIQVLTGGAGTVGLLMFIYGGFQWLTAGGNPEKIKKGRDILLWSVLGMVVMFTSYFTVRFIITGITTGTVTP